MKLIPSVVFHSKSYQLSWSAMQFYWNKWQKVRQGMEWGGDLILCWISGGALEWSCSPGEGIFESFFVQCTLGSTKRFPDLEKFSFFPDFSLTVATLIKLISSRKFLCIWMEWFACGQEIWRQILEKCQIPAPCPASLPPPPPQHSLYIDRYRNVVPFQLTGTRGRDIWPQMVYFCLGLTVIRILINFHLHIIRK